MSVQKSWAELQKMHRACTIVVDTLKALADAAVPGVTTKELMARIGHASPRAALIYQHATRERDRSIASFLDDIVAVSYERSGVAPVSPLRSDRATGA